jgi:RHS repeat-associated protein
MRVRFHVLVPILGFLLLFFFANLGTVKAQAVWTHVGAATPVRVSSGTTCVVTISPAPVAGNTIWAGMISYNGSTPPSIVSVKDANGNSLTVTPHSPSSTYGTTVGNASLAYMLSAPSNMGATLTVTYSAAVSDGSCFADSFQVASGYTAAFDSDAAGSGSSTAINTPSITPATTSDLFYSEAIPDNHINSIGSGWVGSPDQVLGGPPNAVPSDGSAAAYALNVGSALAVNMTASASNPYDSMEGAIEATASGGGTTPSISSLNPTSGPVTTSVTVTGTNFGSSQGSSSVSFNGTTATATSWSATSIVTSVPSGATTGNVIVTVSGVASNGVNFTIVSVPNISNLNPTSGPVGTSVTITGTNFGSSQGSSTVSFNGTTATVTSWSATSIVAPVPSGATTGNVIVTVSGVASNGETFTVGAAGSSVYYYLSDSLGTSRVITASNGTICYDADFYPFGGERPYTNSCTQNYKFTGIERDTESNLDDFGARYDASSMGRFMSVDPLGIPPGRTGIPQSLNLYAYVQNDPISAVDPDGLDCVYVNANSVGVRRGDCASDTDNGYFVDGTIDLKSGTYDSTSGTVGFSYTTDSGALGSDTLGGVYPQAGVSDTDRTNAVAQGTQMAGYILSTPNRWYKAEQAWTNRHPNIVTIAGIVGGLLAGGDEPMEEAPTGESPYGNTPEGRPLSKHYATETGPDRNIPGSVVDETINYPTHTQQLGDRTVYYSANNNVTVVVSQTTGKIMSAHKGMP